MSRSTILARLRQTPVVQTRGADDRQMPSPAPQALSTSQRVAAFESAWESLGGTWELQENATAARLAFLLYLQENKIEQITTWSIADLPLAGLGEALDDAGIQIISPNRRNIDPDVVVGLTSAHAGLAVTGSLALIPGPGQSWLPALLPIRHLILLPTSRLYTDLHHWRRAWEQEGRSDDLARALIITGPSYSSDIELHAHRGMFGPRLLHVLLIRDD